jgi:hypothetical protein
VCSDLPNEVHDKDGDEAVPGAAEGGVRQDHPVDAHGSFLAIVVAVTTVVAHLRERKRICERE